MVEKDPKEKTFDDYAKEEFAKVDKEGLGYITTSQFADFLIEVNISNGLPPLNTEQLGKIMKALDPQNTGKITYEVWKNFLRVGKNASDKMKRQKKGQ